MTDDDMLFLSNEPLPPTASRLALDLRGCDVARSKDGTLESDFAYHEHGPMEGQIFFDPARIWVFSIVAEENQTLPFSFAPDPHHWDLYLLVVPFTLPDLPEHKVYKHVRFSIHLSDEAIIPLDLFPRHILTAEEGKKGYTVSSQGRFQETEDGPLNIGKQLRFAPLQPRISAFEQGKRGFYWTYQGQHTQGSVVAETKHVLAILRVPRGTAQLHGTVACQVQLQKRRFHVSFPSVARTDDQPFHLDLANRPLFRPAQPVPRVRVIAEPVPSADVALICALPAEANALKNVLTTYFDAPVETKSAPSYRYTYYQSLLKNGQSSLRIQISWLPDVGGNETILQVKDTLAHFHPRFMGMTGICAGNKKKVVLGDLVIASHAFSYGTGKIMLDETGKAINEPRIKTWPAPRSVLQAAVNFNDWQTLASQIRRPVSLRQQRSWLLYRLSTVPGGIKSISPGELESNAPQWETVITQLIDEAPPESNGTLKPDLVPLLSPYKDPPAARIYAGVVASGDKVRADDPFINSRVTRGTRPEPHALPIDAIAIDMEGAAFYQTLAEEHIPFLFVKGVSDYADTEKDDTYHEYASTLSAIYMLSFIRSFMANQGNQANCDTAEQSFL